MLLRSDEDTENDVTYTKNIEVKPELSFLLIQTIINTTLKNPTFRSSIGYSAFFLLLIKVMF